MVGGADRGTGRGPRRRRASGISSKPWVWRLLLVVVVALYLLVVDLVANRRYWAGGLLGVVVVGVVGTFLVWMGSDRRE